MTDTAGSLRDVVVQLPATARVRDLILTVHPNAQFGSSIICDGHAVSVDAYVRQTRIKDGSVLSWQGALATDAALWLCLTSGVNAGVRMPLTLGRNVVGSAPSCEARYEHLPAIAFVVEVSLDGSTTVVDAVDDLSRRGEPIAAQYSWSVGDVLTGYGSTWEIQSTALVEVTKTTSDDGSGWQISRPPRLLPKAESLRFTLPNPPQKPRPRSFPLIMLVVPLVVAGIMVAVTRQMHFALFALMSPLMLIGSWLTGVMGSKKTYAHDLAEFEQRKAAIERDVAGAIAHQERASRALAPDPAYVSHMVTAAGERIWERRHDDPDFLIVRLGIGLNRSTLTVEDPSAPSHKRTDVPTLQDTPVSVSLKDLGVVGVCGDPGATAAALRWCVGQLAAWHSPSDVRITILGVAESLSTWQAAKWLPHVRTTPGRPSHVAIGCGSEGVAQRLGELQSLIQERQVNRANTPNAEPVLPAHVVIIDGGRTLRHMAGLSHVLREGPSVGVYVICRDAQRHHLPEEADAVITLSDDSAAQVQLQGSADDAQIRADLTNQRWFDSVCRGLASLRDSGRDDGSAIVNDCSLLDFMDMAEPTPQAILGKWSDPHVGTRVPIGATIDGALTLDIARQGPHGLVAGTTGAGKSELLQSWVASLAAHNSPDDITFILMDYKGGAAFGECAQLPHTVGMVTDLDNSLSVRCLQSLAAELQHRERLFAAAGCANLGEYWRYREQHPQVDPLPRLMIIIDEFAALVAELPEFVTGLVDIAARGRTLGIHLVLATQKPAGVVNSSIRANTNIRICLRVNTKAESSDVIDAPDASLISNTTPGRALVRTDAAALTPFQTARITGPLHQDSVELQLWSKPWLPASVHRGTPVPPAVTAPSSSVTGLSALVSAVNVAVGYIGSQPPRRPWLDALPPQIVAGEHPATREGFVWAVQDVPDQQRQIGLPVDLQSLTHLFAIGSSRSGRTQLIRTYATMAAQQYGVDELHMYGIDCGNGGLSALTALPHVGAVVPRTDVERVTRLISRLRKEIATRTALLAQHEVTTLGQLRAETGIHLPAIVLFLDRWEGWIQAFGELDNGSLHVQLLQLLNDGPALGLHGVFTGDRTLAAGRLLALTEHKLALRLHDPADYALLGIAHRDVPEKQPQGRAIDVQTGVTTQVVLLASDHTAAAQAAAIAEIGAELAGRPRRGAEPFTVARIPDRLSWKDFAQYLANTGQGEVGFGLDPDEGNAVTLPVDPPPCVVVAGSARSGRSNVLAVFAEQLLAEGAPVVIVAPRPSPLRHWVGRPGVAAVLTATSLTDADLAGAMSEASADGTGRPAALIIDDAELLKDAPCSAWLRAFVRQAADTGQPVIVGGAASDLGLALTGWIAELKKARTFGMLTGAKSLGDGDACGIRLTRHMVDVPDTPGRAWAVFEDASVLRVVVPQAPVVIGDEATVGAHRER